ncbi:hypothetical protein P152DRAFT_505444 [Eremomyces bilateralis CBS 781.70]|uniref:F-box domain-containing protein n=1 Tax=Eremomyces bilateralis CBS 781.70 TaxID=1392243 RepID=A0A6G1GC48_9PEZI|nr:uncharacterized protein P152DRAFT_505444 [Eremomyces bilateralis CBS 781.70]KAF1815562.1 hypothetical protein P152DRAFT_505444 [Eremomyces bilateralis CBS 781.70]
MSGFQPAPVSGGSPRPSSDKGVLSSLRATSMVQTKHSLPAEIIQLILPYLPIPTLINVARTSRRMREMVYDDALWIRRLSAMGRWDEGEARRRFEADMRRKLQAQRASLGIPPLSTPAGRGAGVGRGGPQPAASGTVETPPSQARDENPAAETIFDAAAEAQQKQPPTQRQSATHPSRSSKSSDGFEPAIPAPNGHANPSSTTQPPNTLDASLTIIRSLRSLRGGARHEYGRAYKALAPFYRDIVSSASHGDPSSFHVFQTFRDPEQQARMLAQLRVFARSDSAMGWEVREGRLDSMMGVFESAVLREFGNGVDVGDTEGRVRRYARVLVVLNGGASGVDLWLARNPVIAGKRGFGEPGECLMSLSTTHVVMAPAQEFFRRLVLGVNEQSKTIERVFPANVEVFVPFLERVCEDVVGEYVTTLFDQAHERSLEAYLSAVSATFDLVMQFANAIRPPNVPIQDRDERMAKAMAEVFEPHIDLYLQEELGFFRKKADAEVDAWEKRLKDEEASTESFYMSHFSRQAEKRDFLTSFRKVVMMPVQVVGSITAPMTAPFSNRPASISAAAPSGDMLHPSRASSPAPTDRSNSPRNPKAPTDELAAKAALLNTRLEGIKSLFSIEMALNLVHTAKTSLERTARFAQRPPPPSKSAPARIFHPILAARAQEAREQCEIIFVTLLQILGSRHIQSGFTTAITHLSAYNPRAAASHAGTDGAPTQPRVEPLVTFLELVNVGDLIQQMIDVFYVQELVGPKLVERDDFLSAAAKEKKRFEQMLDGQVASGLNQGIDVLMEEVEYMMATMQQVEEFCPAAGVVEVGRSETAGRVVEVVREHLEMLVGSTDRNVLEVFNQEVGVRLFGALCKHIKRQRVSVDGAVRLISDMNHYYSYIVTLKNKLLTEYFIALREVAQIFLISGKHAKEIATIIADPDRYQGIFRPEDVYEFAERRADWLMIKPNVERAMYGAGCVVM